MNMNDWELEMDFEIYNLVKCSNQIVHNRGNALSYMNEKNDPGTKLTRPFATNTTRRDNLPQVHGHFLRANEARGRLQD